MIIRRIALRDFGCIESFEREFDSPITILSGDNGNGKSTVIKAVLLALFDSYSGVLQDYVRWGAKSFHIEVDFSHNNKEYKVVVDYDGASTRQLNLDGTVYTGQEVMRVLKAELKSDLLKAACLVAEQQIDIVTVKPAERRDYLKSIYDLNFTRQLEHFNDEKETLGASQIQQTTQLNMIEGKVYSMPAEPVAPLLATQAQYEAYQKDVDAAQKEVDELSKQYALAQNAMEEFNNLLIEKNGIISNKTDIENTIENLSLKIEQAPSFFESKKASLLAELKKKEAERGEWKAKLDTIDGDTEAMVSALKAKLVDFEPFDEDALTDTRAKISELWSRIVSLRGMKENCPLCGQRISSAEALQHRDEELAVLEPQHKSFQEKAADLEVEKTRIKHKEKDNKKILDEIPLVEKQGETRKLEVQQHLGELDVRLTQLQSDINAQEQAYNSELSALKASLENNSEKLYDFEQRLAQLDAKMNEVSGRLDSTLETRLREKSSQLALYQQNINDYKVYQARMADYEASRKRVEEEKKADEVRIAELRASLDKTAEAIEDMDFAIKTLKTDFPVYVISAVISQIQSRMNEFLKQTYAGRYEVEVVDKKNALHIVYGSNKQDVSLASGYEKALFNLAFKIAISYEIGNRMLILDEADSAASFKNSALFYRTLGNSIGYFNQIILVSHKDEIRSILEAEFDAKTLTFIRGVAES